jgi:hypothetical protein
MVAAGLPQEIMADHDLMHRCNLTHYHVGQAEHDAVDKK